MAGKVTHIIFYKKAVFLKMFSSLRYSHRLNVFVSWMMANSLCYDERINNTDITQLWRHSR